MAPSSRRPASGSPGRAPSPTCRRARSCGTRMPTGSPRSRRTAPAPRSGSISRRAWRSPCTFPADGCHGRAARLFSGRVHGASPSGKAPDFGSGIRRFESCRPSQISGFCVSGRPSRGGRVASVSASRIVGCGAPAARGTRRDAGSPRWRGRRPEPGSCRRKSGTPSIVAPIFYQLLTLVAAPAKGIVALNHSGALVTPTLGYARVVRRSLRWSNAPGAAARADANGPGWRRVHQDLGAAAQGHRRERRLVGAAVGELHDRRAPGRDPDQAAADRTVGAVGDHGHGAVRVAVGARRARRAGRSTRPSRRVRGRAAARCETAAGSGARGASSRRSDPAR